MVPSRSRSPFDLADIYRRLGERRRAARRRRLERAGHRQMLRLDDHLLRDVGLTRGEVERAADRPHAEEPSITLWRLSQRNRLRG